MQITTIMKKLLLMILAIPTVATTLAATPDKKNPSLEFNRHWTIEVQGGASTMLHSNTADLASQISGAAAFYAGYHVSPVFGVRFGVSGWENKGAVVLRGLPAGGVDGVDNVYKWNYVSFDVDLTFDLANWFGGFRHNRLANPYIFAGVALNEAFNNDAMVGIARRMSPIAADSRGNRYYDMDKTLWEGPELFLALRMGAGVDFRVTDCVLVGLELNTNMLSDRYNSRHRYSKVDWQMNALASVKFRIGSNTVSTGPEYAPVESPVTNEPAVEAPKPQPQPAPQPKPAPKPTPEPAKKAEPTPAPAYVPATMTKNILFEIGSAVIPTAEAPKLTELVTFLKEQPALKVTLTGYADADTGSAELNQTLSLKRAESVAAVLKRAGIAANRITVEAKGASVQPFATARENRVVICIAK